MIAKNITLLGDAAHPMVPFLGQGACMAIEDTYSFAMACNENIANLEDAQADYDFVRNKRTKKIQFSHTYENVPLILAIVHGTIVFP